MSFNQDTFTEDASDSDYTPVLSSSASGLRTTATLKPDQDLMLSLKERKQGFLYLYSNSLRAARPEYAFASILLQFLYPGVTIDYAKLDKRALAKAPYFKQFFEVWKKKPSSLTSIKKNLERKSFEVSVPVLYVSSTAGADLHVVLTGKLPEGLPTAVSLEADSVLSIDSLQVNPHLQAADLTALKSAETTFSVKTFGGTRILMMSCVLREEQAEFLVNTPFIQIRNLDVFGPVFEWVAGYYGRFGGSPAFSLPLSKIAVSIKDISATPRLSEDGVCVDERSATYYFPDSSNHINRFEDLTGKAYSGADGSFSPVNAVLNGVRPPPSMPVLIDWVNLKFAYTSLEGRLLVKNLDRVVPMKKSFLVKFLSMPLNSLENSLSLTKGLSEVLNLGPCPDFRELEREVLRTGRDRDDFQKIEEIRLYELYNYSLPGVHSNGRDADPANPVIKSYVDQISKVRAFLLESPENAYARYSVTSVLSYQGFCIIFDKYAKDYHKIRSEDETERGAYLNQGEQEGWEHPSVPLVSLGLAKMPHQLKIANIMRDSPDNAMLPVDAGGGKTIICLTDILQEMKTSPGPYMIMCPAHLVAQYAKELVYATEGRLNAIPISNYVVRRQGFERLQSMLENAPINTVTVVDYDVLLFRRKTLAYGVTSVDIFPTVDFLRQFQYTYVFMDESHFLKNSSSRQAAVNRLSADIRKKRLASGTIVSNTILDLVKQVSLMDPTIFGTAESFITNYALEVSGTKVLEWKPGAESMVRNRLRENCVVAEARRKEWASILPTPRERFHPVDLTTAQYSVYSTILNEITEKIRLEAATNAVLQRLLSGKELNDDGEEVDSVGDVNIDGILRPYLARLEDFMTAPARDVLGSVMLQGEDRISPKALKVVELCREYKNSGTYGKVLIFTNYVNSAEAIYEAFPPDLRDHVVLYKAENKDECGAAFEKDDSKWFMVGVENSMNTGLNLQHASTLIRVNTVWTPGVLEQGNSRIGRPNIKEKEQRTSINYDWIVTNKSIDVTKIAYLIAKTISKSKFDEAGNDRFDVLEVPPLFSMKLETIQERNDFDTTMVDYFNSYQSYKQAVFAEYADYKEKNSERLFNPDGSLKMTRVERAPNPPGCKLLIRTPYVPGLELYKSDQLGLKRYDEFLRLNIEAEDEDGGDEDENESEENASAEAKAELAKERETAMGLGVHTDRGDGEIVFVGRKLLTVMLPSGERVRVRKMAAFVITRANTTNKDIRTQLLKMTGDVPLDSPIEALETQLTDRMKVRLEKQEQRNKKEQDRNKVVTMELELTVVADFLGIRLANMEDEDAVKTAQAFGFKSSPAYYAAKMKTPQHFLKVFQQLKDKGFSVDKDNSSVCRDTYTHFVKQGKKSVVNMIGVSNATALKNFYRMEFKPNSDMNHVNPYPLIQDNEVYLAMPKRGQPGSMRAIRACPVPGVKWMSYEEDSELIAFANNKEKGLKVLQMMQNSGVYLPNIKDLLKQIRKIRITRDAK